MCIQLILMKKILAFGRNMRILLNLHVHENQLHLHDNHTSTRCISPTYKLIYYRNAIRCATSQSAIGRNTSSQGITAHMQSYISKLNEHASTSSVNHGTNNLAYNVITKRGWLAKMRLTEIDQIVSSMHKRETRCTPSIWFNTSEILRLSMLQSIGINLRCDWQAHVSTNGGLRRPTASPYPSTYMSEW